MTISGFDLISRFNDFENALDDLPLGQKGSRSQNQKAQETATLIVQITDVDFSSLAEEDVIGLLGQIKKTDGRFTELVDSGAFKRTFGSSDTRAWIEGAQPKIRELERGLTKLSNKVNNHVVTPPKSPSGFPKTFTSASQDSQAKKTPTESKNTAVAPAPFSKTFSFAPVQSTVSTQKPKEPMNWFGSMLDMNTPKPVVLNVNANSEADRLGFRKGDIFSQDLSVISQRALEYRSGKPVEIRIKRGDEHLNIRMIPTEATNTTERSSPPDTKKLDLNESKEQPTPYGLWKFFR